MAERKVSRRFGMRDKGIEMTWRGYLVFALLSIVLAQFPRLALGKMGLGWCAARRERDRRGPGLDRARRIVSAENSKSE